MCRVVCPGTPKVHVLSKGDLDPGRVCSRGAHGDPCGVRPAGRQTPAAYYLTMLQRKPALRGMQVIEYDYVSRRM